MSCWQNWADILQKTQPGLLAYLVYMTQRLLLMRGLLKPTGAIYLHCDASASHYLKVVMDLIFGPQNFRNEIIWKRTSAHNSAKRWGPVHDVILFYTMSDRYTWNPVYQAHRPAYLDRFYRFQDTKGRYRLGDLTGAGSCGGDSGKPWRDIAPSGRHWAVPMRALQQAYPDQDLTALSTQERLELLDKAGLVYWPTKGKMPAFKRYLSENGGEPVQDIITDIGPLSANAKERLGYPTQKPIALLRRILQASTHAGDLVFDPFCGCGTTIYAAHETGRRWVGCDIAMLPVRLISGTLAKRYRLSEGAHFTLSGEPSSLEQAQDLAKRDPYRFQCWMVEKVEGFPSRKGPDGGIDGRLFFEMQEGQRKKLHQMLLSVKGGHVALSHIRDLGGVMAREHADMAGFLSLEPPTHWMRREAGSAGMFHYNGVAYPRIQLLTVEEVLNGRHFEIPAPLLWSEPPRQQSLAL